MSSVNAASTAVSTSTAEASSTNMDMGIPISTHLTKYEELLTVDMVQGGTAAANRVASQAGAPSTSTAITFPEEIFVLSYNAADFAHIETTSDITLPPDSTRVEIAEQPQGILGYYRSKNQAMIKGRAWLYNQLMRADCVDLPLKVEDDEEWDRSYQDPFPGTWRRSRPDNDWYSYTITDKGRSTRNYREVALTVSIEIVRPEDVDQVEGGQYETDEETDETEDSERGGQNGQDEDSEEEERSEDDEEMDSEEVIDEEEVPEEGRAAAGIAGAAPPAA